MERRVGGIDGVAAIRVLAVVRARITRHWCSVFVVGACERERAHYLWTRGRAGCTRMRENTWLGRCHVRPESGSRRKTPLTCGPASSARQRERRRAAAAVGCRELTLRARAGLAAGPRPSGPGRREEERACSAWRAGLGYLLGQKPRE